MSTKIDTTEFTTDSIGIKPLKIHLLPCKIGKDISAPVSSYFEPAIGNHPDSDDVQTSSLRGRPLLGKTIEVPPGYLGITLVTNELEVESEDTTDKILKVKDGFRSFTYWNWDQLPSKDDKLKQALDWLNVSKAIHDPVSLKDLENAPVHDEKKDINQKSPKKRKLDDSASSNGSETAKNSDNNVPLTRQSPRKIKINHLESPKDTECDKPIRQSPRKRKLNEPTSVKVDENKDIPQSPKKKN